MIKAAVMYVVVILSSAILASSNSYAQDVEFTQTIDPYVCVYTSVVTGGIIDTTDTTCQEQPVPTVNEVLGDKNNPLIVGYFNTAKTKTLRVELNEMQYISGESSELDTVSTLNIWKLEFKESITKLPPGIYTVSVEAQTYDDILLRNNNALVFIVPASNNSLLPAPFGSIGEENSISVRPVPLESSQGTAELAKPQPTTIQKDYIGASPRPVQDNSVANVLVVGVLVIAGLVIAFLQIRRK